MSRGLAFGLALLLATGCAPIDVSSEISLHPREAPTQTFGLEQLARRDFVIEYVQVGPRLLVALREHRSCVGVRHIPVMRIEDIHRTNRGFVAWDFALGTLSGGFAALAFARPQLFSDRLIDAQGRTVQNFSYAYGIAGVFTAVSAMLFAAGIVNGLRSRDTTRYAAAFEVELTAPGACAHSDPAGSIVGERALRLRVGEAEYEAVTNAEGRARFELREVDDAISADGLAPAVLEIAPPGGADEGHAPTLVVLSLRVPFDGMLDAHTGVADTRVAP